MAIEARSIDWVPETERHGRIWHQAPLWFLGNFQYFSIPIGFVGPSLGLSLRLDDPRRRPRHPDRHGLHGLPRGAGPDARAAADDPVARAVRLSRRDRAAVRDGLHLPGVQRRRPGAARPRGSTGAFGWNEDLDRDRLLSRRRAAGDLRPRLGAPDLPDAALHLVPADDDRDDRDHLRRGRRRRRSGDERLHVRRPSWRSSPRPRPTTSPTRRTSRTTRATCRAGRRTARSSPRCSSARAASAIWLIALGAWLAVRRSAPSDGLVGLMTAGNNVDRRPRRPRRVLLGRRARGDDGHERLRRRADRADRGSTPSARSSRPGARAWSRSSG